MRDFDKLDPLSQRILWHVRRGKDGLAITRGDLRRRCENATVAELYRAVTCLIKAGWIGETVTKRATYYWLALDVDANTIKPTRPGPKRATNGRVTSTSMVLPADLRQQLETAANANQVSLTREITRRLASTFEAVHG